MNDPHSLPPNLPIPTDDGGAAHLAGARLADVQLLATNGERIALVERCVVPTVLFFYPRTGVPGQAPNLGFAGEDWDDIPGARGCTPQNCAFRDTYEAFTALAVQVFGVSTQTSEFQRAFKERNDVPFDYLSDSGLELVRAMRLPTFDFPVESGGPDRLIKRMAWFVEDSRVIRVFYPVFPPHRNATTVLAWLTSDERSRE